jgi:hypothetical protein
MNSIKIEEVQLTLPGNGNEITPQVGPGAGCGGICLGLACGGGSAGAACAGAGLGAACGGLCGGVGCGFFC